MIGAASKVPVFHFWCTNWNSFFFLTYCSMMFLPEPYTLKNDDDCFLSGPEGMRPWFAYLRDRPNTIVGTGGWGIGPTLCEYSATEMVDEGFADHVAFIVLFPTAAGKVMHRFRIYRLVVAEDVALGVANRAECRIMSKEMPLETENEHNDGNTHRREDEVEQIYKKEDGWMFANTYCWYVHGGLMPTKWRAMTGPPIKDIRLPRVPQ